MAKGNATLKVTFPGAKAAIAKLKAELVRLKQAVGK